MLVATAAAGFSNSSCPEKKYPCRPRPRTQLKNVYFPPQLLPQNTGVMYAVMAATAFPSCALSSSVALILDSSSSSTYAR